MLGGGPRSRGATPVYKKLSEADHVWVFIKQIFIQHLQCGISGVCPRQISLQLCFQKPGFWIGVSPKNRIQRSTSN